MRKIEYHNPSIIRCNWGGISEVGSVVANYGKKCLMVTVKPFPALEPLFEKIKKLCKEAGVEIYHFDGVVPNPTTDCIDAGTKMGEENQVDVILGVGGGSSMDAAKCISVGITHEGNAWDYRVDPFGKNKSKPVEDKLLPIVAVTTTAGTGAEVTAAAVLTKTDAHLKYALWDRLLCPTVAIVDPQLTITMPTHVTASTGWDSFCHSFESYIGKGASDYSEMHSLKGIELVIKYLPTALKEPTNREAREGMSWANTLGGLAITTAGVTLPHGMGMAIGGTAPYVTHGEALAILYPEINRWTWKHAIPQYAVIGRMFNPALKNESDEVAAEKACDEMDKFLKKIGMWMSFKDKNVPEDLLDQIAQDNFELPDYLNHPIEVNLEKTKELLRKSYSR